MSQNYSSPLQSSAGVKIQALVKSGQGSGWHGFIGGSVSHWISSADMKEFQASLDWNGTYKPIKEASFPSLARECFIISQQEGIRYVSADSQNYFSFLVIQIGEDGESYRILWQDTPDKHPPMEISIHLAVHSARGMGSGGVVYHCQPINAIALASLVCENDKDFVEELARGFAAIRNIVPDGIDIIPWRLTVPSRRGVPETPQMHRDMSNFIYEIAEHARTNSIIMLNGEGILCAGYSEDLVFGTITTVDHAAEIRLKILSADRRNLAHE